MSTKGQSCNRGMSTKGSCNRGMSTKGSCNRGMSTKGQSYNRSLKDVYKGTKIVFSAVVAVHINAT